MKVRYPKFEVVQGKTHVYDGGSDGRWDALVKEDSRRVAVLQFLETLDQDKLLAVTESSGHAFNNLLQTVVYYRVD